jgi:MFS transporter, DHA1 family, multidrug resistance protein
MSAALERRRSAELWALRLATSLFLGCAIPVANLAIKQAAPPERQGAAFGVASSATSTGFALGPIGGGLLASTLGFWAAFLVPGAALLALAVAFGLAWAPRLGSRKGLASDTARVAARPPSQATSTRSSLSGAFWI